MNKTFKKIKDYVIYTSSTIIKSVFFSIIEIHIINVMVNYLIYNTFDIFNLKTIISSSFYGVVFGIVGFYVVRNILRKKRIENDIIV